MNSYCIHLLWPRDSYRYESFVYYFVLCCLSTYLCRLFSPGYNFNEKVMEKTNQEILIHT